LLAAIAVIVLVGIRRCAIALKRLWTKRYVHRTIPTS